MRHHLLAGLASLSLALSMGCGSTSPTCKDTAHLYDLNQANPAGQTGTTFANHAIGVHPVELTLVKSPTDPSRVTPAIPDKTPGTLTVSLAPGAQWSHVISEAVPCSSNLGCNDINVVCVDYYTVPVQARLTAFNGTINETWTGELVGHDPNDPDAQTTMITDAGSATLGLSRDAISFVGNFKVAAPNLGANETLTRHEIILSAGFKDGKLLKSEIAESTERKRAGGADAGVAGAQGPLITLLPVTSAGT